MNMKKQSDVKKKASGRKKQDKPQSIYDRWRESDQHLAFIQIQKKSRSKKK